jgi:hypothetical protein
MGRVEGFYFIIFISPRKTIGDNFVFINKRGVMLCSWSTFLTEIKLVGHQKCLEVVIFPKKKKLGRTTFLRVG